MGEFQDINVCCSYAIRGSDYVISLECKGDESMMVQVEDRLSADQWRATFDAEYIEELTHKTGNFKQFNIFANMLESAITKASDSVILDLLTYSDLESLRHKKSGLTAKSSIPAPRTNHLTSKRYLILTYTVEFDRIHYPLPLPYVGKPDPRALQEEIRSLRAEIAGLKQQQRQSGGDHRLEKLVKDFRRLEREKHEIEQEFAAFRREVRLTSGGSAVKDIRALKAMVRNLEDQLLKEKTRNQRTTNKRSTQYRDLLEEVEELRASERNLRVRLKSLTNELAMYKRGRPQARTNSRDRVGSGDRVSASTRQRSSSNDRLPLGRAGSGDRLSRPRPSPRGERPPFPRRSNSTENISRSSINSGIRARSNSFDRNTSANGSRLSTGSHRSARSRTPSPAASRKFNPTAYIKEKERREKEAKLKKQREHRANLSGLSSRSRQSNSSRHSGCNSLRSSRENSIAGSDGYASDGSYTGRVRPPSVEHRLGGGSDFADSPAGSRMKSRRLVNGKTINHLASTPDNGFGKSKSRINRRHADSGDEDTEFDRSAEISEIDERLDRLQQLMKVSMP